MRVCWLVAAVLLAARPLAAQQAGVSEDVRHGFWIGFGAGWAAARATCDDCSADRVGGIGGWARAGVTISPHLLIGGEFNGWSGSHNGTDEWLGFLSASVTFYPSRVYGFYVKASPGGMRFHAFDGTTELEATAPSLGAGVGYEFPIGRPGTFIVPYVNWLGSTTVTVTLDGQEVPSEEIKVNLLQLGVGLIWH